MAKIIGVRFKPVGKIYYFNPLDFDINENDSVIVETSRGIEFGTVVTGITDMPDENITKPLKEVIRIATAEDIARQQENKENEKTALETCREKGIMLL